MLELDKNGNLIGVTGLRQLNEADEWTFESVAGWPVHGNKFVLSMNGIEIRLTEQALYSILATILNSPEYQVEV